MDCPCLLGSAKKLLLTQVVFWVHLVVVFLIKLPPFSSHKFIEDLVVLMSNLLLEARSIVNRLPLFMHHWIILVHCQSSWKEKLIVQI
mmetsp:Transcript_14140/g.10196  ORF Transcript_14140/g.10196 Transcript_14140/m.10196 type:complete len:88 (-) Transcript_14140:128-391(-)